MPARPPHVILGAGPAGLAAAHELTRASEPVRVLEASPHVGGLARSFVYDDHIVDLGPHRFFTRDERVLALWREVLGEDVVEVPRLTRIFYRGRFFHYPLRPWNAFFNLGPLRSVVALLSYLKVKLLPERDESSFEGWVVDRFGRVLFETFFKTYTEKLWGVPCSRISSDWAAQRIKGLSLGTAVLKALGLGGNVKSMVEQFEYPVDGAGGLYTRMAARVEAGGGEILRRTPAVRIHHHGGRRVVGVSDVAGTRHPVEGHLISSMPLTLLIEGMDPPAPEAVREAAGRLRFRNTILVYLMVNGVDLFPDNWIYVHSTELGAGRVTNFRNWAPGLIPEGSTRTPLVAEYWCFDEDELWATSDAELIARAGRELEQVGLVPPEAVLHGEVIRLRRCYPVYEIGFQENLAPVIEYLRGFDNLLPIGRYGSFKYNNQDHSLLMGILAAGVVRGEAHDLWAVNQDDDYQEEKA